MSWKTLKEEINIEEELDRRNIDYRFSRGNREIVLRCPIHNDKDFAFRIVIDKTDDKWGCVNCFGCKFSGTVFHLLAELDDITFGEELKRFNKDISVGEIKRLKNLFTSMLQKAEKKNIKIKPKIYKEKNLKKFTFKYSDKMKEYIESRDIDIQTSKNFELMYCNKKDDKFYGKMVFVYRDTDNKIRSFGFRKIGKIPKSEIKIYKLPKSDCSQMLYGLRNLIRNNYFNSLFIILNEGEFDVQHLQNYKFPAVGLGHKDITDNQIDELIKHKRKNIIILLDGDVKEQELIDMKKRIKSRYIEAKIKIVRIREKKRDPNDLTEKELMELLNGIL